MKYERFLYMYTECWLFLCCQVRSVSRSKDANNWGTHVQRNPHTEKVGHG